MTTARDVFEIAYDLAYGQPHGHKVADFRACDQPSCQALARIAGPVTEEKTDG